MVVNSVAQQVSHNSGQQEGNVVGQQGDVPRQQSGERPIIWQGILEWLEKGKNPNETQGKQQKQVRCQVSANSKDGELELKADSWPSKLIMQLMPKQLIGSVGGSHIKNSKSVLFHPTPCEALDSLTKVMSTGFAGCVHFTSPPTAPACDIKVLILLYTLERRAYLGFIPNDQTAFVDRLRKVIQHQKSSQILRQNQMFTQGAPGPANNAIGPGSLPTAPGIPQGGIMMSQTNTMAMCGGQIIQNVVAPNNLQQNMANAVPHGQMRPVMANNSGLRHLLQQPQPQQYRQQMLGMQQQMVGPGGQMAARQMTPGNPQNQQFDYVPNFDYLGFFYCINYFIFN